MHTANLEGWNVTDQDLPPDAQPMHVRHCIDYLRQSLMCLADTTIEHLDEKVGGVKGFGTQHQCKDFKQLVQWTTKWAPVVSYV